MIRNINICRAGDFMVVGYLTREKCQRPRTSFSDMEVRRISETVSTRAFSPGISIN